MAAVWDDAKAGILVARMVATRDIAKVKSRAASRVGKKVALMVIVQAAVMVDL